MSGYQRTAQYEQPRVPERWQGGQEKQFVIWLTQVLDEMYLKFGRIDLSMMSQAFKDEWSMLVRQDDLSLALSQYGHHIAIGAPDGLVMAYVDGPMQPPVPAQITLVAQATQVMIGAWEYQDALGNWHQYPGASAGAETLVVQRSDPVFYSSDARTAAARIRLTSNVEGVFDTVTVRRLPYTAGTVAMLSTETMVFTTNETGQVYYQVRYSRVSAYTGTEKVIARVGQITGIPDGMGITVGNVSENLDVPLILTVAAGATFGGELSGEIVIPVIIGDTTLTKRIEWSLVKDVAQSETKLFRIEAPSGLMFSDTDSELALNMVGRIEGEEIAEGVTYLWEYQVGNLWQPVSGGDTQGIVVRGSQVPLAGTGADGFRNYRATATYEGVEYADTVTVSHAFKQAVQTLVEIMNSLFAVSVTQAQYLGDSWSSGSVFPSDPMQGQAFTLTASGDIPRFYIYDGTDWVEYAGAKMLGSGFRIEPDLIEFFTSRLMIRLMDPDDTGVTLLGLDNTGVVFTGKDGNVRFRFDIETGDLTISGIVNATAGNIGGFLFENGAMTANAFELTNKGKLTTGYMTLDPKRGFWLGDIGAPYVSMNKAETYLRTILSLEPGVIPYTLALGNLYMDPTTGTIARSINTTGAVGPSVSVVLSNYAPKIGEYTECAATAQNATGALQYKFELMLDGVVIQTIGPSVSRGFSFTPTQVGTYHVRCTLTANGVNTQGVSRAARVATEFDLEATVAANPMAATVGQAIIFSAQVSGNTGAYTVVGDLYKSGTGRIGTGSGATLRWVATAPGEYYVIYTITDTVTSILVSSPVCTVK